MSHFAWTLVAGKNLNITPTHHLAVKCFTTLMYDLWRRKLYACKTRRPPISVERQADRGFGGIQIFSISAKELFDIQNSGFEGQTPQMQRRWAHVVLIDTAVWNHPSIVRHSTIRH